VSKPLAFNIGVHPDEVRTDFFPIPQSEVFPKTPADVRVGVTPNSTLTSSSILNALGNESSRRILASAVARGMTVDEISTEQNISLSTCYDKIGQLVDEGLMILEKRVITRTGRRFAVYRTSFSDATIKFSSGEIEVETKPNAAVLGKLHDAWLSSRFGPDHH
jgi:hypothetical protein